jgi:hypothetical protein
MFPRTCLFQKWDYGICFPVCERARNSSKTALSSAEFGTQVGTLVGR